MSTSPTVSVRSVVVTVGVLLAVIVAYTVAYTVGSTADGTEVTAAEQPPADATADRQIVMRGTGDATGVPDQLSFKLSLNIEDTTVSEALNRTSIRMRRVAVALKQAGVARKDLQTTGLDIRPVYDYSDEGPAVITGYVVSEDTSVLVRSLDDAGSTITAAVSAGGNAVRLHGLSLKIGNENKLMREARDRAVAEASSKASQYADATGQELADVLSIKEVTSRRSTPAPAYARDMFDARAVSKVPIKAGSAAMSVTVSVKWQFA